MLLWIIFTKCFAFDGLQCRYFGSTLLVSLSYSRGRSVRGFLGLGVSDLKIGLSCFKTFVSLLIIKIIVALEVTDAAARAAPGPGRRDHRRRQLALSRRHRAREAAAAEGHPLRRHGHERRRVGPRARLLPDDRRRDGRREAARSDLQDARARRRRHPSHARPREARRHGRERATCTAGPPAPATS